MAVLQRWLPAAILVLSVLAVFAGVLDNDFVSWDDGNYLVDNPYVRGVSAENLRGIFTTFRNGNYHPLPFLSYAVEYEFFGLSPRGYHAVSLLWHAVNALLVFALLRALRMNVWAAFGATLLYALHPMRVEAVAWITARKDLMCTGFSLGALLAYISWVKSGLRRDYCLVLGSFLLALLSKGTAIVLPPLFLIIDHLLGRRVDRQCLLEKWPHAVIAVLFTVLAFMARASFQEVLSEAPFGPAAMLVIAIYRLAYYYLVRTAVPAPHLASPYPADTNFLSLWFLTAIVICVVLVVLLFMKRWRVSRLSMGCWFFLIAIAPALWLPVVGFAADRFAYFPAVGLACCVGWGLEKISRPVVSAFLVVPIGLALGWATVNRCEVWRDSVSLYSDSVALFEGRPGQEWNLSRAYVNRGRAHRDNGQMEAALGDFTQAVRFAPQVSTAWISLGEMQLALKEYPGATDSFVKAIQLDPKVSSAWQGRSIALRQSGELDQALAAAEQAVRLSPGEVESYSVRGLVFKQMGRHEDALKDFSRVIELAPRRYEGYFNRGFVLDALGREDLAARDFAAVLQLAPDNRRAKEWLKESGRY